MGTNNVPFHKVRCPSTQLGTEENWILMMNINVTVYLNAEDGKFSKSIRVGIFGNEVNGNLGNLFTRFLRFIKPENVGCGTNRENVDFLLRNNTLLIENLLEVELVVAELVCKRKKLLQWLLAKIKVREIEGIKQYTFNILAILFQNSKENQNLLEQMNSVDIVLEGGAMNKSKDATTADEEKMLKDILNCLCRLLMPIENKESFVNEEGVELMIIIIRQRKYAYRSANWALNFTMTNDPTCERYPIFHLEDKVSSKEEGIDKVGVPLAFRSKKLRIKCEENNFKSG